MIKKKENNLKIKGCLCLCDNFSKCVIWDTLRSFLFITKIMNNVSFSGYLSVCIFNHPIIHNICDIMMSINTWDRVHFWIYFKAIRWVLNFAIKKNQKNRVFNFAIKTFFSACWKIKQRKTFLSINDTVLSNHHYPQTIQKYLHHHLNHPIHFRLQIILWFPTLTYFHWLIAQLSNRNHLDPFIADQIHLKIEV